MIEHTQKHLVKPGMTLKGTGMRDLHRMTTGKDYVVIEVQEGYFPDRPYVIVKDDYGRRSTMHLLRFSFIEEDTQ